MTRLSRAILLSLCVSACSGSGDDGDEHATGTVNQPVVTASWIHPACDGSSLLHPSNDASRCNGPWVFSYQDTWMDPTACGPSSTCASSNSCTSWDKEAVHDGLGYLPGFTQSSTADGAQFCPGGNPAHPPACTNPPATFCQTKATAYAALISGQVPSYVTPAATASIAVTWTSTVNSVVTDPEPPEGGGTLHAKTTYYTCTLNATGVPHQMTGQRGGCGCATYVPAECAHGPAGVALSEPGLAAPKTPGTPSAGSIGRLFVGQPSCTTCDATSVSDPASAQALFKCLDASLDNMDGLGTQIASADVIASVASRMELLFEIAADKLTTGQQTRGLEIYKERPTGLPQCGVPVTLDAACVEAGNPFALASTAQMCNDVAVNPASSRAVAQLELATCLNALPSIEELAPGSCQLATRDFVDVGARGVLTKAQPDYSTDLAVSLPIEMSQLNAWWPAAKTAAPDDPVWLFDRVSQLTRGFWSALEQAKIQLPAAVTTDAQAVDLLADVANVGLTDEIAVIAALFDASQASVAPSPMMLVLTSDALRGLEDRINRLEAIHDVGCRFVNCKLHPADSQLAEVVHALSVLPNASQLSAVMASAGSLQTHQPGLHAALSKLAAQHARLEGAWQLLGTGQPFTALATLQDPPVEAAGLAKLVSEASLAWASYAASGEFVPGHRPRLTVATLEQSALAGAIETQITTLSGARTTYTTARLGAVNDLLGEIQNQTTQASVVARDGELLAQLDDANSRSRGLEAREAAARTQIAQFQQAFEAIAPSLDTNGIFQATTLTAMTPSGSNAKHVLNAATNLVADQFDSQLLAPGEALRFHVTDGWSPTCALHNATVGGPGGPLAITVPSSAKTSSTGYYATVGSNSYLAHTETSADDSRLDIGVSAEACVSSPFGVVDGLDYKICEHINADEIWDDSTSNANGTQSRFDASFVTGIRLPGTPYPVAPVGSLVAVTTPKDNPNLVLNVHVVQADDVIVAPALPAGAGSLVEVHFVVNDGVTSGCTGDTVDHLRVEMVKTKSIGSMAQILAGAMATTLQAIEADAPQILAQGQLSADESTALRTDAWTRLQLALPSGTSLSGIPSDLHQLFESYVNAEIASISRRAEMHAVSLQREQLDLELAANLDELHAQDQQARLLFLIPRWRLRDLSGIDLSAAAETMALALTSYAAPVFELRDPSHYTALSTSVATQASNLINVDVTAPLEDEMANLQAFATAVHDAVSLASFELPTTARRTVVIAIPRPATATNPNPTPPEWLTVSDAAAKTFWDSAQDTMGHPQASARLNLAPSDLYVFNGSSATLTCSTTGSDVAPVIRKMAVYIDTFSPPASQVGAEAVTRVASRSDVAFPLVGSVAQFETDDPRGMSLPLPVLFGGEGEVLDKFAALGTDLGVGAGLSPFTSYDMNLSSLSAANVQDAWNNAKGLYLVFDIERVTSNDPPDVEGVCVNR